MRVIAGKAKRLVLKTIEGLDTRPTTDRIKETLFNMIQDRLYDCEFLDLFAGSGAIGIEALSRGAKKAVFVENNPKAVQVIKENLAFTKLLDHGEVLYMPVADALKRLEREKRHFDVIFMDPPYHNQQEKEVLIYLSQSGLADEETLFITEAAKKTDFDYLEECGLELIRLKEYKTNMHVFIQKAEKKETKEST